MSVPPLLHRSIPLAGGLLPRSRRAWKISAISAGCCLVSTSGSYDAIIANLTITFARIAAISSPLMNAVADKRTDISEAVVWFRRSSLPGNHLRCDLDSPAAATAMTFFRTTTAENLVHDPLNLSIVAIALRVDKPENVSALGICSVNIAMTMIS